MSKPKVLMEKQMDTKKLSEYLNAYKFNTTLPGTSKIVNFKPISTFQLKELASGGQDADDALDKLINDCVTDKDFDVKDLALQDRFFLLVELRIKSKGATYSISYRCDKCDSQFLQDIDLSKMKVNQLKPDLDYVAKLDENIGVELSLLTRNVVKKATALVDQLIKDGTYKENDKMLDESIMAYVLSIKKIITPAGTIENPDIETSMMLFKSPCPLSFYDKMSEWYTKIDFGMDFKFDIVCTHCGRTEQIEVSLENFFS
jgi:hypothetical protein